MQERLQKILSRAGVASRRAAEALVLEGRVSVNGVVVRELGTKADPATDDIQVDGARVRTPAQPVYFAVFKPKGVICTRHDPEGRPTVMSLVPPLPGLFPVGRLDTTTEGVLLLTNDGAFAERASHPRYEVPRVYHAKVYRVPDAQTIERLTTGVFVEGKRMRADRVRVLAAENNSWIEVTLHEGRNHEVRRLLEAVGHPVSKLRRVAFGPVSLKGLLPGQFRSLTSDEVRGLMRGQAVARPPRLARAARSTQAGRAHARRPGATTQPATTRSTPPTTERPSFPRSAPPLAPTRPTKTRPFPSRSTRPTTTRPAGTRSTPSTTARPTPTRSAPSTTTRPARRPPARRGRR